MKYRLMGTARYLDAAGIKIKITGNKQGVVISHTMSCPDNELTLKTLNDIITALTKVKSNDVHIPEHIKLTLKQKE